MTTPVSFREAQLNDAPAIGALHVTSWRETYAGFLPDQLLSSLSVETRSAMWKTILEGPAAIGETAVFVAESGGSIVGFGACGNQRDQVLKEQGFDAEVYAIYVLQSHQRAGVGNSLMGMMARNLLDQGRTGVTLWVLRENGSARSFYEKLGGALAGEMTDEESGVTLTEIAYGWRDLSRLQP